MKIRNIRKKVRQEGNDNEYCFIRDNIYVRCLIRPKIQEVIFLRSVVKEFHEFHEVELRLLLNLNIFPIGFGIFW